MTVPSRPDNPSYDVRTARVREIGLALALLTGPWLIVAANTGDSIMKLNGGGDDTTPEGALMLARDHLTLDRWSNLAGLLGALLLVPAFIGVLRFVGTRAARLGLVGCVLAAGGYVCYFALLFQGGTADAMVAAGGPTEQDVRVLQAFLDDPRLIWVPLMFVLGNLVGTFLAGLALVRARTTPRFVGYALMGWSVFHLLGFPFAEVIGAVLQAVGLGLVAVVLIRRPASAAGTSGPQPYELLRR